MATGMRQRSRLLTASTGMSGASPSPRTGRRTCSGADGKSTEGAGERRLPRRMRRSWASQWA
eukprot:4916722-Alexandrium_andersonii.AAC.1